MTDLTELLKSSVPGIPHLSILSPEHRYRGPHSHEIFCFEKVLSTYRHLFVPMQSLMWYATTYYTDHGKTTHEKGSRRLIDGLAA